MANLLRNWLAATVVDKLNQGLYWKRQRNERNRSRLIKREPTSDAEEDNAESSDPEDDQFSDHNNTLTVKIFPGESGTNRWVQVIQVRNDRLKEM